MSRILIVDDNQVNRYFLEALLQSHGYRTASAENGEQALELACQEPPDLIISDILMPVMDGFDLCRVWRTHDRLKEIPFIFYTATYTEPKDESLALSLGADRFVIKPQEPDTMLALVREVLAGGPSRPEPPPDASVDSEMEYLRQHNATLFDKLSKKVRDLEASQLLTRNLFENSPALIYIVDCAGRFMRVNHQMERSMKRSEAELIGKAREAFLPLDIAAQFRANDQRVLETGHPVTFEEVGREPDGEHIYFTVKFPLRNEAGENFAVCGISTDITEFRTLERNLQQLTDLHVMLYQVNRAIRSARTEADLFKDTCRLCIDFGRFDLAWIGWVPIQGNPLRPDFAAGSMLDYLRGLAIPTDASLSESQGPSLTCLREDRPVVCEDWSTDPMVAPWRTRAATYGIRSSAALPIALEGHPLAVLNLYSARPGFFTQDRLRLLEELTRDLSFAIHSLIQARNRERAEKALAAREMEFRAAFEQGAVGMAQVSQEGRFLNANHRLCEILGYASGELNGRHVRDITHPDDQEVSLALLQNLAAGLQDSYQLQKRYLRKDGQAIWVELSGSVVRDPEGKVLYYLSAFDDITQRRAAALRLQEEKARLQGLIESIPDLVWLKDLEGRYQACNPRFEAYCGIPEAGLLGKTDHDFEEKALADLFMDHDSQVLETGEQVRDEIWVTFASDGHQELLEIVKTVMKDAAGSPMGILGIARDVTRNRQDQERLRKLSNAIEHSPMVVVITDRNGTIEHVNPRFSELTGYTLEEAVGANPRILKSGATPTRVYEELWNTILDGRIWHGELQNRKKNGEIYWESTSISPIRDDAGQVTHFVALKEDITHLKQVQNELQAQLAELRRWHEATLGRETRVLDLKREVNALLARLGESLRYASVEPDAPPESRP